jgi:ABC-2 type transport system permease protein
MPELVRGLMSFAPTTHYVSLAQSVLFRGAGLPVVWPQLLMVAAIGAAFFALAHHRLRQTISAMQA